MVSRGETRLRMELDGGVDRVEESFRPDRFRDVTVHARGQAPLAIALHRVRGHADDRHVGAGLRLQPADGRSRLEAVHLRHLHVHQHHVESLRAVPGERLATVSREDDGVSFLLMRARC